MVSERPGVYAHGADNSRRMAIATIPQTPRLSQSDNAQGDLTILRQETSGSTGSALPPRPAVSVFRGNANKATREKRHFSTYMGLVTWTTVKSWNDGQSDDSKLMPDRRGKITLQVPFCSVQVDFHYTQFMGTPSYALNINHVIDPSSDFGNYIFSLVLQEDLPRLKKLLSDRKLSIYSLYGHSSLFSVSVLAGTSSGVLLCPYGPSWLITSSPW